MHYCFVLERTGSECKLVSYAIERKVNCPHKSWWHTKIFEIFSITLKSLWLHISLWIFETSVENGTDFVSLLVMHCTHALKVIHVHIVCIKNCLWHG